MNTRSNPLPQPSLALRPTQKSNVVYIWFMAALALIIVALLWFIFDNVLTPIFSLLTGYYPTQMGNAGLQLLYTVWSKFLPIAFFGIAVWCFVQAQKERAEVSPYG